MSRSRVTVGRSHSDVGAPATGERSGRRRALDHALTLASILVFAALLLAMHPNDSRGGSAGVQGAALRGAARTSAWAAAGPDTRHANQVESTARTQNPPHWVRATLSHYGTTDDGYLGKRTTCGKTVTAGSMFVAALKPDLAHCGARITIHWRGRTFHVRVQDRGGYRSDDRALDAAPGLRRAMGNFSGTPRITYSRGWH